MKAEEFIKEYTSGCSNELCAVEDRFGKKVISYHEWLTPEQALAAVEIAREEVMQQLLKDAVECDVISDGIDLLTTESFSEMSTVLRKKGAKEGDKVKIIIVKE